jgi:hypothetical protein
MATYLRGHYELGNDFHTRVEGTRIKHHMGPVAIKPKTRVPLFRVMRLWYNNPKYN